MHTRNVGLFLRPSVIGRICASYLRMVPWLIVVFALVLPCVCWAVFYSYTDKNGVTHFTDNLADIPEEQLPYIKTYQKSEDLTTLKKKPLPDTATTEPSGSITPMAAPSPARQERDPVALEGLKGRKAALDIERTQLEKEQAELVEEVREVKVESEVRARFHKMKELNDRFVAHQKKRDAFEKDWDAYHSSLKDLPEFEGLRARKAALDMERTQLQKERAELAEKGGKLRRRTTIRAHRHKTEELNDRFAAYQKKRDAFEKDWDAYHSLQ